MKPKTYECRWSDDRRTDAVIKIWRNEDDLYWQWYYRTNHIPDHDGSAWWGTLAGLRRKLREQFYVPADARFKAMPESEA